MSIFLNENSKVIVQGMTGSEGRKHTQRMLASGTAIVGGVNPSKAGQNVDFDGASVPVFGSVAEAMKETGADVSVLFVPPKSRYPQYVPQERDSRVARGCSCVTGGLCAARTGVALVPLAHVQPPLGDDRSSPVHAPVVATARGRQRGRLVV